MATETLTWIAAADKLPDSDITVLVFAPAADDPVACGYHDGEYWFEYGGRMYGNEDEIAAPVTHWAQLPEGPKK